MTNAKSVSPIGGTNLSNTQKSIVSGMTVLSLVGIICKIVGALYRIPLA